MVKTATIHATNAEGFHVEFTGEFPDEYDALRLLVGDTDFGYKPTKPTAPSGAVDAQQAGTVSSDLACQFCGASVEPYNQYTAAQIAQGRRDKLQKTSRGNGTGTACSKCWARGGHKAAWDQYYAKNGR